MGRQREGMFRTSQQRELLANYVEYLTDWSDIAIKIYLAVLILGK